jgi:hypothetical protein
MWAFDGLIAQTSVPLPPNTIRWRVTLNNTDNPYSGAPFFDEWSFFHTSRDVNDSDRWENFSEISDYIYTSEWSHSTERSRGYFAVSSLDYFALLYFSSVTIDYEYGG